MATQPRKFQHAFGRPAKTTALDATYNHRRTGVNIDRLREETGHSYPYAVAITQDLEARGPRRAMPCRPCDPATGRGV